MRGTSSLSQDVGGLTTWSRTFGSVSCPPSLPQERALGSWILRPYALYPTVLRMSLSAQGLFKFLSALDVPAVPTLTGTQSPNMASTHPVRSPARNMPWTVQSSLISCLFMSFCLIS